MFYNTVPFPLILAFVLCYPLYNIIFLMWITYLKYSGDQWKLYLSSKEAFLPLASLSHPLNNNYISSEQVLENSYFKISSANPFFHSTWHWNIYSKNPQRLIPLVSMYMYMCAAYIHTITSKTKYEYKSDMLIWILQTQCVCVHDDKIFYSTSQVLNGCENIYFSPTWGSFQIESFSNSNSYGFKISCLCLIQIKNTCIITVNVP